MFVLITLYVLSVIVCFANTSHNKDLSILIRGFVCLFPIINFFAAIILVVHQLERVYRERKNGVY